MRFGEIDYLRGYAVILVVVLHFILSVHVDNSFARFLLSYTELGVGVDLFFVISGFVVSCSLSSLWDGVKDRKLQNVPLIFYRKRFLRLWPASAVWLVICFMLSFLLGGFNGYPYPQQTFAKLISGLFYLYNFKEASGLTPIGYFWSLSVEWQFYLAIPLLVLAIRDDSHRLISLIVLLFCSIYYKQGGDFWWLFRFTGIIVGIICYMIMFRFKVDIPKYGCLEKRYLRIMANVLCLIALVMAPKFSKDLAVGYFFSTMISGILVVLAATDRGYVSAFFLKKIILWIGVRSYSIYLSHIPVIYTSYWAILSLKADLPVAVIAAMDVILIAIFSELTYRFIELPSHKLSRSIKL